MKLLIRWALTTLALFLTVRLNVGLHMPQDNLGALLITSLVIGLVNAVVRPILIFLTLPLTVVTFGLFLLVVNAIALGVAASITPLQIDGFGGAIFGALVLSIVNMLLFGLFKAGKRR